MSDNFEPDMSDNLIKLKCSPSSQIHGFPSSVSQYYAYVCVIDKTGHVIERCHSSEKKTNKAFLFFLGLIRKYLNV